MMATNRLADDLRDLRAALTEGRAYAEGAEDRAELERVPSGGRADPHVSERRALAAFRRFVHDHRGQVPTDPDLREALGGNGSYQQINPLNRILRDAWSLAAYAGAAGGAAPPEPPRTPETTAEVIPPDAEEETVRALLVALAKVVDARVQRERTAERRSAEALLREERQARDAEWHARLQQQAALHQVQTAEHEAEIARLRAALDGEVRNAAAQGAAADALQEGFDRANQELATVRPRLADLERQLDELATDRDQLRHRAETAEGALDAARRAADALRLERDTERQSHAAEIDRLDRALTDLRGQRDARRAEADGLRERLSAEASVG